MQHGRRQNVRAEVVRTSAHCQKHCKLAIEVFRLARSSQSRHRTKALLGACGGAACAVFARFRDDGRRRRRSVARGEEGDEAAGLYMKGADATRPWRSMKAWRRCWRAAHVAVRPAQLLRPVHRGDAGAAPPRGVLPGGAGQRAQDARAVRAGAVPATPRCTCCSRWARCTSRARRRRRRTS